MQRRKTECLRPNQIRAKTLLQGNLLLNLFRRIRFQHLLDSFGGHLNCEKSCQRLSRRNRVTRFLLAQFEKSFPELLPCNRQH